MPARRVHYAVAGPKKRCSESKARLQTSHPKLDSPPTQCAISAGQAGRGRADIDNMNICSRAGWRYAALHTASADAALPRGAGTPSYSKPRHWRLSIAKQPAHIGGNLDRPWRLPVGDQPGASHAAE